MSTSGLWRTARPRFPMYSPDGRGRDYYIKYDNAGYWADQFHIKKIPDYERYHYNNFHSLIHQPAPFKYWGNGNGRETYILQTNGLFHDQKPLCCYKLSDFLRTNASSERSYDNHKKRLYMSVSEKKYKNKLRKIEKKLIKRLYASPISMKKPLNLKSINNINNDISPKNIMGKNFNNFNKCNSEFLKKNDYEFNKSNSLKNINNFKSNITNNNIYDDNTNKKKPNKIIKFNKTCRNFFKNRLDQKDNKYNLGLNSESDLLLNDNTKTFKNIYDYNNKKNIFLSPTNNIKEENDLRFIDPRSKYKENMKINFNFKQNPRCNKIKIKKINII